MKKIFFAVLAVVFMLALFDGKAVSQQKTKDDRGDDDDNGSDWYHKPTGTWDGVIKDGILNIQLYGKHWHNGRNFDGSAFGTLPTDKIGEFSLTREAGKINFKGVFLDHTGHGTFQFDENA